MPSHSINYNISKILNSNVIFSFFFFDSNENRYAVQLLTPSSITSKANGRTTISKQDVVECASLFKDSKTSAKVLKEQSNKYLK